MKQNCKIANLAFPYCTNTNTQKEFCQADLNRQQARRLFFKLKYLTRNQKLLTIDNVSQSTVQVVSHGKKDLIFFVKKSFQFRKVTIRNFRQSLLFFGISFAILFKTLYPLDIQENRNFPGFSSQTVLTMNRGGSGPNGFPNREIPTSNVESSRNQLPEGEQPKSQPKVPEPSMPILEGIHKPPQKDLESLVTNVPGKGSAVPPVESKNAKTEDVCWAYDGGSGSGDPHDSDSDYPSWSDFDSASDTEITLDDIDELGNAVPGWEDYILNNPLPYEASDSEEVEDEHPEFDYEQDQITFPNSESVGYQTAKDDSYTGSVIRHHYNTQKRLSRLEKREIWANRKEAELFSTNRSRGDIRKARSIQVSEKRVSKKLWRHPDFFGLERLHISERGLSPRVDFFYQHKLTVSTMLDNHFQSPNTRCFENVKYREHTNDYDVYWNRATGKVVLVDAATQEVFTFWNISKMQRIELLNHNKIHKHYRLNDLINQQRLDFENQDGTNNR